MVELIRCVGCKMKCFPSDIKYRFCPECWDKFSKKIGAVVITICVLAIVFKIFID